MVLLAGPPEMGHVVLTILASAALADFSPEAQQDEAFFSPDVQQEEAFFSPEEQQDEPAFSPEEQQPAASAVHAPLSVQTPLAELVLQPVRAAAARARLAARPQNVEIFMVPFPSRCG